jgi:hypothetical protein
MKTQYKPRSWKTYNKSLVERGSLTIWLTPEAIKGWLSNRRPGIQGGRTEKFSDSAILALMFLKSLYRMPYRMLEGFSRSLLGLMKLDLPIPHFTRICKRSKKLDIPTRGKGKRITDVVLDGSGIKIYGEGEWKVKQHGRSNKQNWKKIHVAIDPETQELILTDVTDKDKHDSTMLPSLLKEIQGQLGRVFGDGAYDTEQCYKAIMQRGGEPMIPPRKTAALWKGTEPWVEWRNQAVLERLGLGLDPEGLRLWKKLKGYGLRSLVETFFSRFKRSFGDRAYSRSEQGICLEIRLKCEILNRLARLGLPQSVPV